MFLMVGVLITILLTVVYVLISSGLSSLVIGSALSGRTAYALLTVSLPCIIVVYVLLNGALFLNYLPTAEGVDPDEITPMLGKRKVGGLSQKLVRGLTIAIIAAMLPIAVVSAGTYRTVSDEGISTTVCFIEGDVYAWEKVSSYEIACDNERGLSITFKMRNGTSFEILQNTVSAPDSFKSAYPCKEAFAVDILKKMDEHQIPCSTFENQGEHRKLMEAARTFYRNDETLWSYVKLLVRYQEVIVTP